MMNIDETKQRLISLLQTAGTHPMHLYAKKNLHKALDGAQLDSEVAQIVSGYLKALYKTYGEAFLEIILRSLTPEVWEKQCILINPAQIPSSSLEDPEDFFNFESDSFSVVADGSVKTVQSADNSSVTYYGNVDLIVKKGFATVMGTCHPVMVENLGYAGIHGATQVIAQDRAILTLYDTSRALINGQETCVKLFDRTFAECKQCIKLSAYNQAQFVVHKDAGLTELEMDDTARGALLGNHANYPNLEINMMREPVLYVPDKKGFVIHYDDGTGLVLHSPTILEGCTMRVPSDLLLSMTVPRFFGATIDLSPSIVRPLAIERLKEALQPLLPAWDALDQHYFAQANDEREVCDLLTPYLPEMVKKGLTGNFLRQHFTELTLNEHGIYTNYELGQSYPDIGKDQIRYFFGDGRTGLSSPIHCYEHTLYVSTGVPPEWLLEAGISWEECTGITVGQQAGIIITEGEGEFNIQDNAKCIAAGDVNVQAKDASQVWLEAKCEAKSEGHALVTAYDSVSVTSEEHSKLILHDNASANVTDATKVLALGDNQIIVGGRAEVAFSTMDNAPTPEIKLLSNEATLRRLDSVDKIQDYAKSLQNEPSIEA